MAWGGVGWGGNGRGRGRDHSLEGEGLQSVHMIVVVSFVTVK